jgi:selenocysteine-specific elongation factor
MVAMSIQPLEPVRHLVLGTAGHIDHGKTALVRALTGIEADRLPEEQARGMTIELGFAHLALDGLRLGIVDVPGHERFVRTMVAGATGIDMVMLVIAADDSVMPQTREHVDILRLLDVRRGVVVLTKCDLVDEDMLELVDEEVGELLSDTPLSEFRRIRVSSVTGHGVETLKEALRDVAGDVPPAVDQGIFRMAIDRVFTIHGRGTVVTGSATAGQLDVNAMLELQPSGLSSRARGMETHSDEATALSHGQRAAINLSGIDRSAVRRGDELATPGYLTPATTLDAELYALAGNARALKNHQKVRLCMGTAERMVRLRLLDGATVDPSCCMMTQMHCAEPTVADWGQRFIIRDETNAHTLGGGIVLRPVSRPLRGSRAVDRAGLDSLRNGDSDARLIEAIRFDPHVASNVTMLANRTGLHPEEIPARLDALVKSRQLCALGDPPQIIAEAAIEQHIERSVAWLQRYHTDHPDQPGCLLDTLTGWLRRKWGDAAGLCVLERLRRKKVRTLGRFCCLREYAPKVSAEEERLLSALTDAMDNGSFQPPAPSALPFLDGVQPGRVKKLVTLAVAMGDLVQVTPDILLHTRRFEELKSRLADHIHTNGPISVSEFRTLIDSSRKYVVPILEYLDRIGYTTRKGDSRQLAASTE